jgi:dihydrofolate synthase / folylpolyglutamate synthase
VHSTAEQLLDSGQIDLHPTYFETVTAMAFLLFRDLGAERVVLEVGLGGRLDATNVVLPLAVAVTGVALDHTDLLGATLEEIAAEKAGIFKPGVPALVGERAPGPREVFARHAAEVGAPLVLLDDVARVEGARVSLDGTRFRLRSDAWGELDLHLPLPGLHQARNAALAAELLALLPAPLRPSADALVEGFAAARWPGRMQVERIGGGTWILDVAHNPAGAEALAATLDALDPPRPRVLVAAVLADKAWEALLRPLLERVDAAVLTVAPSAPAGRRWDPAAAVLRLGGGVRVQAIPDLEAALLRAGALAPRGTVVVTGSVHTVGDAMAALRLPVG